MTRPQKYTRTAIFLHWVIAAFILVNIVIGVTDTFWPKSEQQQIIAIHKSIGMTVLGLVILRILWRATHKPPPEPAVYKPWERWLSHIVHSMLYVLILFLPVSGYLHDSAWSQAATHPNYWFGLIYWPRAGFLEHLNPVSKKYWHATILTMHAWFAWVLLALLALHVSGALKHQFLDKEKELQRMTP